MEITSICKKCDKKFKTKYYWVLDAWFIEGLHYFKMQIHYAKEHQLQFMMLKGIWHYGWTLIVGLLVSFPLGLLWLISYPFWWIHDRVF